MGHLGRRDAHRPPGHTLAPAASGRLSARSPSPSRHNLDPLCSGKDVQKAERETPAAWFSKGTRRLLRTALPADGKMPSWLSAAWGRLSMHTQLCHLQDPKSSHASLLTHPKTGTGPASPCAEAPAGGEPAQAALSSQVTPQRTVSQTSGQRAWSMENRAHGQRAGRVDREPDRWTVSRTHGQRAGRMDRKLDAWTVNWTGGQRARCVDRELDM